MNQMWLIELWKVAVQANGLAV